VFAYPLIFGVGQSNGVIEIYPLSTSVAIATIQKLQNFALQPMEISQRYNSVPVKVNCVLFAPTPLFSGPGCPMMSLKFLPCRPLLPWQQIILEQN